MPSSQERPTDYSDQTWHILPCHVPQQFANLRHGQREACSRCCFHLCMRLCGIFFLAGAGVASAHKTARYACAIIANVMCRYQPSQLCTSYWSSPTSPLAASKHSSTVQRVPATRTIGTMARRFQECVRSARCTFLSSPYHAAREPGQGARLLASLPSRDRFYECGVPSTRDRATA
jgi:hypothetical protein